MARTKPAKVIVARERSDALELGTRLSPCARCTYCLCICRVLREHRPECAWRRAVIGPFEPGGPQPCVHGEFVCARCVPACAGCAGRKAA